MTLVLLEYGARGGETPQLTINVAAPRGHPAFARCIAMDNPPPCGYYSRMMASESVLRRRDRLSDHAQTRSQQSCEALRRGAMGIYRVFAGSDGESHIEELRLEDHPE